MHEQSDSPALPPMAMRGVTRLPLLVKHGVNQDLPFDVLKQMPPRYGASVNRGAHLRIDVVPWPTDLGSQVFAQRAEQIVKVLALTQAGRLPFNIEIFAVPIAGTGLVGSFVLESPA
ncbi:hypothetical protein [Ahniella affigens]|uniref:hypothetical protein n=1 Tax=Ahniella affigens TaxID=2021234 RepID=UPI0011B20B83|nr:hypothetical protein [Ahniella affigens]